MTFETGDLPRPKWWYAPIAGDDLDKAIEEAKVFLSWAEGLRDGPDDLGPDSTPASVRTASIELEKILKAMRASRG